MARPTKYSPERVTVILNALRGGNTRTASAGVAEINIDTFNTWMHRYPGFSAAVSRAEADAEIGMVANITKAVDDGDTVSARWWLERRRHADWMKHEGLDVSGDGIKIVLKWSDANAEED